MNYNNKRNFRLLDYPKPGKQYGDFNGKYPSDAAKKIYSMLCNEYKFFDNDNGRKYLGFNIIDTDSGKIYEYIGTSVKLNEPIKIKKGHKEFYIHYRPIIAKFDINLKNAFTKTIQ